MVTDDSDHIDDFMQRVVIAAILDLGPEQEVFLGSPRSRVLQRSDSVLLQVREI